MALVVVVGTPQSWEGKGNGSVKSWGRKDEVYNIPKELIKKQKQNIKRKRNNYMGGGRLHSSDTYKLR